MRTVAAYSTPAEAHVAITRLESAGIVAGIRDEIMITLDWTVSNAVGGVKIEVPDEEAEAAREILGLTPPEEGVLHCPHCGAADGRVRVLSGFALVCVLVKLPIPMTRAVVDCRRCRKCYDVPRDGQGV